VQVSARRARGEYEQVTPLSGVDLIDGGSHDCNVRYPPLAAGVYDPGNSRIPALHAARLEAQVRREFPPCPTARKWYLPRCVVLSTAMILICEPCVMFVCRD
jgi:hypothetical protein